MFELPTPLHGDSQEKSQSRNKTTTPTTAPIPVSPTSRNYYTKSLPACMNIVTSTMQSQLRELVFKEEKPARSISLFVGFFTLFPFYSPSLFSAHLLHSDTLVSAKAHQLSSSADRNRGCYSLFSLLNTSVHLLI